MKKMSPEEAIHYCKYIKCKRLCDRYDVSEQWVYDRIALNEFPAPKKFGKLARWSIDELLAWEVEHGWRLEEPIQETC